MLSIQRLADSQHSLAPASATTQGNATATVMPTHSGELKHTEVAVMAGGIVPSTPAACCTIVAEGKTPQQPPLTEVVVSVGVVASILCQLCRLCFHVRLQLCHLLLQRSPLLLQCGTRDGAWQLKHVE